MNILNKVFQLIIKRKITVAIIIVVVAVVAYFAVKALAGNAVPTRYVLATVEKGTILTSVTGSGQISATNQVDIKSKASGDVLDVFVTKGQTIKEGDKIALVDASDAYKALRDAQTNLETAQLSLKKLTAPPTALALMQAENALATAKANLEKLKQSQPIDADKANSNKQTAQHNIDKGYEDAFSNISDAFLDLPTIITGLDNVLYGEDISKAEPTVSKGQDNYSALINSLNLSGDKVNFESLHTLTENDYKSAREKYTLNFENYKKTTRFSSHEDIEALLTETIDTVKAISASSKSEINYLDTWVDYRTNANASVFSTVTNYQSDVAGYMGQVNGHITKLLTTQTSLTDNQTALADAENNLVQMGYTTPLDLQSAEIAVSEQEAALQDLKDGADPLDIRSSELTVRQRQDALTDAQDVVNDYTIKAPFDGMIAELDLQHGDSISSGTVAATVITNQRVAEISLNEVDVAKIKIGQKATLTFDAISDLTISGKVADIDILGTVSQGVVTYNVKILFDTQDERIKPGMSVSAAIITDIKQDVLTVANAAVKTSGASSYVEMPDETVDAAAATNTSGVILSKALKEQPIEIGLANDSLTEVISGLNEGDLVVSRTISSTAKTTTATQGQSLFNMGGAGGGNRAFRGQ